MIAPSNETNHHATPAAAKGAGSTNDAANDAARNTNIVWHAHNVTRQHRETLLRQKAAVLWFTGLSGSGKSTIANALAQRLHENGRLCYVLDGDNVRHGLNADLGFSQHDREENIRRVGEVAKLLCDCGIIVATAFISPYTRDREAVSKLLGDDFIEIHVRCPIEECERRDVKGLYAKARRGEIPEFTGVTHPYEEPTQPAITIDTSTMNVDQCVDAILMHLIGRTTMKKPDQTRSKTEPLDTDASDSHALDPDALCALARKAGAAILDVYHGTIKVEHKDDKSPLTEADLRSNNIITQALATTGIPVITEESANAPYEQRKGWRRCYIVDPLDGTKEFVSRNGEFTVNIALVEDGVPVQGVVYAPATDVLYYADMQNADNKDNPRCFKETGGKRILLSRDKPTRDELIVVASRSHMGPETQAFIDDLSKTTGKPCTLISSGSSLKLCLVAEGSADVYPRLAPTMEWDTAAAHAIARATGRKVTDHSTGKELTYNKQDLHNPWFVVRANISSTCVPQK